VEEMDTKYSGPEKCGADVVATRILEKFSPRKISRSSAPEEFTPFRATKAAIFVLSLT
jgi:hypothetical protein